jgi:hypothetical protein
MGCGASTTRDVVGPTDERRCQTYEVTPQNSSSSTADYLPADAASRRACTPNELALHNELDSYALTRRKTKSLPIIKRGSIAPPPDDTSDGRLTDEPSGITLTIKTSFNTLRARWSESNRDHAHDDPTTIDAPKPERVEMSCAIVSRWLQTAYPTAATDVVAYPLGASPPTFDSASPPPPADFVPIYMHSPQQPLTEDALIEHHHALLLRRNLRRPTL